MAREKPLIERSPQVLSGAIVFAGTRVPVQTLFDYLEEGDSLEDFLEDFPTVSREHAIGVMEIAKGGYCRHSAEGQTKQLAIPQVTDTATYRGSPEA